MENKTVRPVYGETFFGFWVECPNCNTGWGGGHKDECPNCKVEFEKEEKNED